MTILDLSTNEQIEYYEFKTGKKMTNLFDLDYFVFMEMLDEIK